jgi:hypothetical protein
LLGLVEPFPSQKCRDGLTSRSPLVSPSLWSHGNQRTASEPCWHSCSEEGRRATRAAPDRRTSRVTFGSAGRGRPTQRRG